MYNFSGETINNHIFISITDMYNPDRCYNECGNLTALMAYNPVLDFVKNYIEHLTNAVNSNF